MTGKNNTKAIAQAASTGLAKFPDVAAASPPTFNNTGQIAIVQVTPKTATSTA